MHTVLSMPALIEGITWDIEKGGCLSWVVVAQLLMYKIKVFKKHKDILTYLRILFNFQQWVMTMATLALYPDQIVLKVASAISFRYKKYSGHLLFSNFHKISLFFCFWFFCCEMGRKSQLDLSVLTQRLRKFAEIPILCNKI